MGLKPALALSKLQEIKRQTAEIDGHKILFLWHDEQVYAVQSKCPHLGLPLQNGAITDKCTIVCPWHKSEFDLKTGHTECWSPWPPVVGGLLGKISKQKDLKVYATSIDGDQILVDIPE
jgi:nitrite reductase/ring-hydroxylating ferredoxin subunit